MDEVSVVGDMLAWVGVGITLAINLATVAYMSGSIISRLNTAEKEIGALELDLKELRQLKVEMAEVKSTLHQINTTLNRFMALVEQKAH